METRYLFLLIHSRLLTVTPATPCGVHETRLSISDIDSGTERFSRGNKFIVLKPSDSTMLIGYISVAGAYIMSATGQ